MHNFFQKMNKIMKTIYFILDVNVVMHIFKQEFLS